MICWTCGSLQVSLYCSGNLGMGNGYCLKAKWLHKIPHVYSGSPSGAALRYHLLPNRVCFSEAVRSGRLGKKNPASTTAKSPSSLSTKGLSSEQRAGWDWKVNADTSSLQLWTGGLRAAAKVICLHISGQEMQFNPSSDWSLYKINGNVSMALCSDSTKSESNFSPGRLLSEVSWFLVFKSSKLSSRTSSLAFLW